MERIMSSYAKYIKDEPLKLQVRKITKRADFMIGEYKKMVDSLSKELLKHIDEDSLCQILSESLKKK